MDLVEMLSTIWRTKWIIIITAAVAAGVVAFDSFRQVITYRAEATLLVGTLSPESSALGRFGGEDKLALSYAQLVSNREVLEKSIEIYGLPVTVGGLRGDVGTVPPPKDSPSPFVMLYAVAGTPAEAVNEVNAVAEGLAVYVAEMQNRVLEENRRKLLDELSQVESDIAAIQSSPVQDKGRLAALEGVRRSLISQFETVSLSHLPGGILRVISLAENATPSRTHPYRNTAIAFAVGAVAGIGIGFGYESVRKALRREGEKAIPEQ